MEMSDEARVSKILRLIGDKVAGEILAVLQDELRPASDIARLCTNGKTSVYRKLQELTNIGLLTMKRIDKKGGLRPVKYFKATYSGIEVGISKNKIQIVLSNGGTKVLVVKSTRRDGV